MRRGVLEILEVIHQAALEALAWEEKQVEIVTAVVEGAVAEEIKSPQK